MEAITILLAINFGLHMMMYGISEHSLIPYLIGSSLIGYAFGKILSKIY